MADSLELFLAYYLEFEVVIKKAINWGRVYMLQQMTYDITVDVM